ncbi:MAG: hypothetical protein KF767_17430 [Bdellovibrionaceae bacterium]|nr:hypothetical protein [Pseudobdellovibrionaceae bacterium]
MASLFALFLSLALGPMVAHAQRAIEIIETPAPAADGATQTDGPTWTDGLHLLAGGGVNFSSYSSRFLGGEIGTGFNLKTDLGFEFGERWAFDLGSSLKFNAVQELILWDTLLTAGLRHHFADDHAGPFVRVFAGVAPSVLEVRDRAKMTTSLGTDVDRLVFDGEVLGASVGWSPGALAETSFIEASLSVQTLRREKSIADDNQIPVVMRTRLLNGDARIWSLGVIWGARIF